MRRLALALAALTACSTQVDPVNPWDRATPPEQQAAARVAGRLAPQGLASSDGLDVALRQNGALVRMVPTSGGGAFLFPDVVPGSYVVEAAPPGFVPVAVPLALAAGADVDLGDLALVPLLGVDAATLEGTALLEGQASHGGILVEAVGRAFTAVTASDGRFLLTVSEGTYDLRFTRDDFVTANVAGVTVGRGETRALDPVTLPGNPASVAGTVEGERPDGSRGPLADALVTLEGTGITGLTDAAGGFTLTGIPAGSYLLRAAKDGFTGASVPVLNLAGGELRVLGAPLELALGRGRIAGTVALADAADASGVVVDLTGTGLALVTGASGAFAFDGLVAGVYEVAARREGYGRVVRSSLTVAAGATADAGTLTLARQGGALAIQQGAVTADRAVTLVLDAATAAGFRVSEDPAFADPARGDTLASPAAPRPYGGPGTLFPFTLGDADGRHEVYAVYYDAGGTASAPASASVVLDRRAPAVPSVVVEGGAAYTRSTVVGLALSAEDAPAIAGAEASGLASVELSADPTFPPGQTLALPYAVATTWPLGEADGPRTVHARFVDRAGNVSTAAQASIVLDRTEPENATVGLSGGAGAAPGTTGTPLVTASLSADDANAGAARENLQVRLSNAAGFAGASWQPYAPELAWFVTPGDGAKTVYAQFRDPAGNESLVANAAIALLATPPQAGTLVVAGGAAATSQRLASVAVTASGATEMRFLVDGVAAPGGWVAYATAAIVDLGASDGPHLVSVSFRNAAGVEGGGTSAAVRLDRSAPGPGTLAIAGTLGNGAISATLSASPAVVLQLAPADADAAEMALAIDPTGGASCAVLLAAPAWQPVARTATVVLPGADGPKRACVVFRDAAGNFAPASAVAANVTLDTTPPSNPSFVNVASGTQRWPSAPAAGSPQITAALDATSGVVYQCLGGDAPSYGPQWTDCGTSTTLPSAWALPANRESALGVRARDAAYNASPGSLVRILHDDVAPFPPFIVDLRSSRDSVTVTWDATGDTDVVDWVVRYGNAAGDAAGTGAAQGPSPISAGARAGQLAPSFTLTNLTPGLPYYVSVEAVDAAGNRSGPSGERLAVPNRANPRFLSTFAGLPRSAGTISTAGGTWAYLGENQAIVQLQIGNEGAAPVVTGRAFLPDLVPDDGRTLAVFACTRHLTAGHCVLPAGSTLEGEFRGDRDAFRAAAPVVFFPLVGTAAAPAVGTIEAILPVRPTHVFATTVGGEPLVVTVDHAGIRAFTFKSGNLSFLRQVARADRATPLRTVHAAGLNGTELYVYGVPMLLEQGLAAELEAWELSDALSGDVYPLVAPTPLQDDAGWTLAVDGAPGDPPVVMLDGGVFASFVSSGSGDAVVASYLPGDASPQSVATVFPDAASDGGRPVVGASIAGQLYVWTAGGLGSPLVTQVNVSGLSLAAAGTAWSDYEPRTAAAFRTFGGLTRLLTVEPNGIGTSSLQRWTVAGAAITQTAFPFEEIPPEHFAESDHLLYVSHGDRIHTVELSNPYTPRVVASRLVAGRSYRRLVVHGRFLYAVAGTAGVDVFRLNSDGTLTLRVTLAAGDTRDVAVVGRFAFVAAAAGIRVYDVSTVVSGGASLVTTLAPPNGTISALAARRDSSGVTSYDAVVYALMGTGGAGELRTFSWNGAALAALSGAAVYPGAPGDSLTVKGDYAIASTPEGSFQLSVASPASPFVTGPAFHPVAGPAQLQAGYVTGLAPVSGSSGPAFAGRGTAAVDGAIRFSTCAADGSGEPGSLVHRDGWYAASCQRNGIALLTPAALEGGRLLKSYDVSSAWNPGAALATDGMNVWFAGPTVLNDASRLYLLDERSTAEGTLAAPSAGPGNLRAGVPPDATADSLRGARAMAHADGVVFVATARLAGSPTVDAFDPSATPWLYLGRLTLAGTEEPVAMATDGEALFVARNGGVGARIDVIDVRNPAAMALRTTTAVGLANRAVTTLALARDRLYAPLAQGAALVHEVRVYDVSTVPAGGAVAALQSFTPGWEGGITGLSVAGPTIAYTVHDPEYRFPRYGLVLAQLGPNLDGTGAAFPNGSQPIETAEPLQSPVLAGDVLYVASNLGVQSWDLRPWWLGSLRPTPVGGVSLPDGFRADAPVRLQLVGPFGYLVGGTVRAFDLR